MKYAILKVIQNVCLCISICICIGCDGKAPLSKDELNNKYSFGDSLYSIGDSIYYKELFKEAIHYYKLSAEAFIIEYDTSGITKSFNDIGLSYRKLGIFDSARYYYNKAFYIDSIKKDTAALIGRLRNIGITYNYEGDYGHSIDYFTRSIGLAELINSNKNIAALNNSLGNLYNDQGRYTQALKYYEKSLDMYKHLGLPNKVALVYNNIGNVFKELKNYDEALRFHNESLILKDTLNNQESIAYSLHNIGDVYKSQKRYLLSQKYLLEAYTIRKKLNDKRNIAVTANVLAGLYIDQKDTNQALLYLNEAKEYYKRYDDIALQLDNMQHWINYFDESNKYELAYKELKKWTVLNDSIFNLQKINVQEVWNQFELQQEVNATLKQKQIADQKSIVAQNRLYTLWLLIFFIIIVLSFLFILYKQRINILKLNDHLDLLNTDIRHSKNNDYQQLLLELKKLEFHSIDSIENMLFASVAVDETLYDELGKDVNIKHHLETILEEKYQALLMRDKGVVLNTTDIESVILNGSLTSKLTFIICELVTNSIKHSLKPNKVPEIKISINKINTTLLIKYCDKGDVVTKKELDTSNGLGWKIINRFVKQLDGNIHLSRTENWNIFQIEIKI